MPKTINIVDVIIKEISMSKDGRGKYVLSVVYFQLTDIDSIVAGPAIRRQIIEIDLTQNEKQRITKVFDDLKNKIKQIEGI